MLFIILALADFYRSVDNEVSEREDGELFETSCACFSIDLLF